MAQLAEQARMRILENNQYGFTLIELLIVILIIGVFANFSVYSVNLLDKHEQNLTTNQLTSQIQSARHKAQMFNFSMRINLIENKGDQQIVVEYFDPFKRAWRVDGNIEKITLTKQDTVLMDVPFININANGFITDGQICINDECLQSVQK